MHFLQAEPVAVFKADKVPDGQFVASAAQDATAMVAIEDPRLLRGSYRSAQRRDRASLSSRFVSWSVVEEPVALSASDRCLPPLHYESCARAVASLTRRSRHEWTGRFDRYRGTLNAIHREVLCVACARAFHDRSSVYPLQLSDRLLRKSSTSVLRSIGSSLNTTTQRTGTRPDAHGLGVPSGRQSDVYSVRVAVLGQP